MFPIRTILHPNDLSEESAAAFQLACVLARDYGAHLVLLTTYPKPASGAEMVDRDRPDGIEEDLLAKLRELKPADPAVAVEYRVGEGDPADLILATAEDAHADLIVMGTHGRGGLRRAIMGSVAEAVNRKATCPVMTVRSCVPIPTDSAPTAGDPVREVSIPLGSRTLQGTLQWAGRPRGVIVFAHGSGSSRHSPRNWAVARTLVEAGFATLLMDLLTVNEGNDREKVFDVGLLASRLATAAKWVAGEPELSGLPIGLFGASTGSAAALIAAATHPELVSAVVSRGGRPDLAWDELPSVQAPTLLIVGGDDEPVLSWNRDALEQLACVKELTVVPGATHLFEEPGTLEQVAQLARGWFTQHLSTGSAAKGKPVSR